MRIIFYPRKPTSEERKKERKRERHVEILFCTKKVSILSYQRNFLLHVLATRLSTRRRRRRTADVFVIIILARIIGVHFDRRKSVDLGTKSKKKEQKSTIIIAL
jgi:hypothetical protein